VPSFKPKKRASVEGKDVKSSLNRLYREQENPGERREEGELVEPQESGVKREPGESNEIVQAMQKESSLNLSEAKRLELREKARRISAKFKKSSVTSSKPFSETLYFIHFYSKALNSIYFYSWALKSIYFYSSTLNFIHFYSRTLDSIYLYSWTIFIYSYS